MRQNLIDTAAAAARLGLKPDTLMIWRSTGKVCVPFVKIGRAVRYRPEDLDAFIAARLLTQTGPVAAQ